jgi:hypothetical protein
MFTVAVKATFGGLSEVNPNCLSFGQITLQVRGGRPGMPNRNVDGISKVACTSRHAPASDKLRTEHGRCAFLPRIIVPDLSIRLRGTFRGFRLDIDRSHSSAGAAVARHSRIPGRGPDEGVHRSPRETVLLVGAAAVPVSRIAVNRKQHLRRRAKN